VRLPYQRGGWTFQMKVDAVYLRDEFAPSYIPIDYRHVIAKDARSASRV
jgi:hypothetical protein